MWISDLRVRLDELEKEIAEMSGEDTIEVAQSTKVVLVLEHGGTEVWFDINDADLDEDNLEVLLLKARVVQPGGK